MLWSTETYLQQYLRQQIAARTNDTVLLLEQLRFHGLDTAIRQCHYLLTLGRWLFFQVLVLAPIIYALLSSDRWGARPHRHLYWALLALDLFLGSILFGAVAMAIRARVRAWERQSSVQTR